MLNRKQHLFTKIKAHCSSFLDEQELEDLQEILLPSEDHALGEVRAEDPEGEECRCCICAKEKRNTLQFKKSEPVCKACFEKSLGPHRQKVIAALHVDSVVRHPLSRQVKGQFTLDKNDLKKLKQWYNVAEVGEGQDKKFCVLCMDEDSIRVCDGGKKIHYACAACLIEFAIC